MTDKRATKTLDEMKIALREMTDRERAAIKAVYEKIESIEYLTYDDRSELNTLVSNALGAVIGSVSAASTVSVKALKSINAEKARKGKSPKAERWRNLAITLRDELWQQRPTLIDNYHSTAKYICVRLRNAIGKAPKAGTVSKYLSAFDKTNIRQ